jgi:Protein of unknown function (DUF1571)
MDPLTRRFRKKRRLLVVLAGLVPVFACVTCLAVNPTLAIRALELALGGRRSGQKGARSDAERDILTSRSKETPSEGAGSCTLPEAPKAAKIPGKPEPAIAASFAIPRESGIAFDKHIERTGATKVEGARSRANEHDIGLLCSVLESLKLGRERFAGIPNYSATFLKRERIGSELTDLTTLQIKVRRQPFSIYMKWLDGPDAGKEALYSDGNDDRLLVRLGGFKGRLIPAFNVDPDGALALSNARYPITKAGILGLADELIAHREQELKTRVFAHARQQPDADCDGRPCSVFVFEFDDPERSPEYRKSIQYLDRQWNVPLVVENYAWPEPGQHLEGAGLDESTLIEYYKYSNVVLGGLTDDNFSPSNHEYRFRR